jgi:hypothetical protein
MSEPTKRYRVKEGMKHGAHNEYGAGDILELTESEARGFMDKLELAEKPDKPVANKSTGKAAGKKNAEAVTEETASEEPA